ncbi:MAG: VTT domain-containing protein [Myxococcales bacterium]|nr:VTT domain-containing protein [Myxococcales bacterium]
MSGGGVRRAALVLGSALLVYLAYTQGWVDLLKRPDELAAMVRDAGALGVAAYLAVFVVLASAGVPAVVFMVPAPLLWPWPLAVLVAIVGGMISSVLGFLMARYVLRDFVRKKIPPRLLRPEPASEREAFKSIVISRLVLFIIPPTNWAYGLSSVSTRTYVVATFVGALPGFFFYTLAGGAFFAWLGGMPKWVWGIAAAVVVAFVVFRRRRMRALTPP